MSEDIINDVIDESLAADIFESSLNRVWQHTQNRNIAMLTSQRGELSDEENKQRYGELKHAIRSAGYGYIHVQGAYTENKGTPQERKVKEHSFLVVGKKGDDSGALKGFAKQMGEKYGQESVLHKKFDEPHANLIGTSEKSEWLKKGQEQSVGEWHPNRAGEFHSILRNRHGHEKTFTFESVQPLTDITFLVQVSPLISGRGREEVF